MSRYIVHFASGASQGVEVEYDGEFDADAIAEAASEDLDTTLCHQCSKVELGDFEHLAISDSKGEEVWSAADCEKQYAIAVLERLIADRASYTPSGDFKPTALVKCIAELRGESR